MVTALLGSNQRSLDLTANTNALLSASSKQTGVAAPTFSTPTQVAGAVSNSIGSTTPTNPADIPGNPANKLVLPSSTPTPDPSKIDTSRPNPQTVNNVATSQLSPDSPAPQNLVDQVNQAGEQVNQLKQKYGTALTDLNKSGVTPPNSQGAANAGVGAAIDSQPPTSEQKQTSSAATDSYFNKESNPAIDQTTQNLLSFLSPPAIQTDISNAMAKLLGDQGTLSAEKLQLMNMQNVMAGTPDDIRTEVTKANGFATESQVQALAVARNQTLLKQSSQLQNQIQFQQDQINTDSTLLNFEKDMANTQFTQRMSIMNYQQTQQTNMLNAARDSLKAVATAVGYDGLYKSVANDPIQMARDEQILGLGAGGLAKLAGTPTKGSYEVIKGGQDAFGNPLPDKVFNKNTGQFMNGGTMFSGTGEPTNPNINPVAPIIGSGGTGSGQGKLSFNQYGLLANTDFKPTDMVDQIAQKYIDQYIKNGTVPTASSLGRNMKPEAMAQVDSRARDLYFKATGEPMPNPEIIKSNQKIISSNNTFANNLKVQESTVKSNFGLNLENLKASDLNTSNVNAINSFLDNVKQFWQGNPEAAQYALQNSTIQNEVGSLLAVRNASGTTVHDKLVSAGLIPKGASFNQQTAILKTLMQEADNAKASFSNATGDLYKQIDPLMQDANNPLRAHMQVESALNASGTNYQDVVSKTPNGQIPVLNKQGQVGYIKPEEFTSEYIKL